MRFCKFRKYYLYMQIFCGFFCGNTVQLWLKVGGSTQARPSPKWLRRSHSSPPKIGGVGGGMTTSKAASNITFCRGGRHRGAVPTCLPLPPQCAVPTCLPLPTQCGVGTAFPCRPQARLQATLPFVEADGTGGPSLPASRCPHNVPSRPFHNYDTPSGELWVAVILNS